MIDRFNAATLGTLLFCFFGFFLFAGLGDRLPNSLANITVTVLGIAGVGAAGYLTVVAVRGRAPEWLADLLEIGRHLG